MNMIQHPVVLYKVLRVNNKNVMLIILYTCCKINDGHTGNTKNESLNALKLLEHISVFYKSMIDYTKAYRFEIGMNDYSNWWCPNLYSGIVSCCNTIFFFDVNGIIYIQPDDFQWKTLYETFGKRGKDLYIAFLP